MNKYIYLIAPVAAWAISQLIKITLDKINDRKLSMGDLLSSGGMPSSHVAGPVAFLTVLAHRQGMGGPLFGLGFLFTVLMAYDSLGVRRTAAESAEAIKKINQKLGFTSKPSHIFKGHNPIEVLGGVILGVIVGAILLALL